MSKDYMITGSIIEAYIFCPRQAWLLSRQILGNQDNDFLAVGRLITEKSYEREKKEVTIDGGKIDFVRTGNGGIIVAEVKKSSKFMETAKLQLLFYLYQLDKMGQKTEGEIRIPSERRITRVLLTDREKWRLEKILRDIENCISQEHPPEKEFSSKCKRCSYAEFCFG